VGKSKQNKSGEKLLRRDSQLSIEIFGIWWGFEVCLVQAHQEKSLSLTTHQNEIKTKVWSCGLVKLIDYRSDFSRGNPSLRVVQVSGADLTSKTKVNYRKPCHVLLVVCWIAPHQIQRCFKLIISGRKKLCVD
jgi:hypothetical protein